MAGIFNFPLLSRKGYGFFASKANKFERASLAREWG